MTSQVVRHRRLPSERPALASSLRRVLLVLALAPLILGILLIVTALAGVVMWRSPGEQVAVGCLYVLFSFAASNALQKQWRLAFGWVLFGLALGLAVFGSSVGARAAAAALAGVSAAIVARQFMRRRRQYLDSGKA